MVTLIGLFSSSSISIKSSVTKIVSRIVLIFQTKNRTKPKVDGNTGNSEKE